MEVWKVIDFNPGYSVSTMGRIKNNKTNEIEELHDNGKGYLKKFGKYVHRIVGNAFIPNPEGKSEINHKNGIKSDNRVDNLEWVTHQENQTHLYKKLDTPERKAKRHERMAGSNNPMYGKVSANKGKAMTEEQKRKISVARIAYWERTKFEMRG